MKNRSFLIVSRSGKPVRSVTLTFFKVFFPVLFVALGLAAYFIPQDIFRLKEAEQAQKKELKAQNKVLHERFFSTLKVLSSAKEQIRRIEKKKEKLSELTGTGAVTSTTDRRKAQPLRTGYENVTSAALRARVSELDSIVSAFAALSPAGKNPFECLPVCKPVAGPSVLTRRFGANLDPFTGRQKPHRGVDFAAPVGTPVIATASGRVTRIETSDVWGKRLVLEHGNGISTVYAHLGKVSTARGRSVKRGAIIGYIGVSGLTSGPHVHYEVLKNGEAVDPEELFFPARGKI
jgi:murein DD-endopeptidase MepM/ murein hydrolase activator NlpD